MPSVQSSDSPPMGRHYGLDWLRVGAFVLLIFYHIGMVFAPGSWMIKAPHVVEAVAWPMVLVQPWRMPLLFAVSGFASYALLRKSPAIVGFVKSRSRRLLLPLLFGTIFVVAPQWWIKLINEQGYSASFATFWWDEWLSFSVRHGHFLPDTGHLWFIAYLWTYTVTLAALVWLARGDVQRRLAVLAQWLGQGSRLLWAPLLPLMLVRVGLLFTMPEVHGVLHDWVSDAIFLPPFFFGFAIAANPGWWQSLRRILIPAALTAAISGLLVLVIEVIWPDGVIARSHVVQAIERDAALVMAWSMVLLLFALANRWLNHDHRWRGPLCEAVFPFYIAHQTVIVLAAAALNRWHVPAAASFPILVVTTFGGCWLFYRAALISGPLRLWTGLGPAWRIQHAASPSAEPAPRLS